jgi:hypothetical protein
MASGAVALAHCDGRPKGPVGLHFDDGSQAVKFGASTVVIDPLQTFKVPD